jgi:alanine racemase
MFITMNRLVWVELDAQAPDRNVQELKSCAAPHVLFCAVVKSNAYGHGIAQMVQLLRSVDWFGVNSLEEGIELRETGVSKPILVLGHVPLDLLKKAVDADLRLTVYNRESINVLKKVSSGKHPVRVHLKVETGTHRQGILPQEIGDFTEFVSGSEGVILEGVSTHFANIEDTLNHEYSQKQLARFHEALRIIEKKGSTPPIIHTASTAATILFPQTHFNMLRAGIGVYGLWPSRETFISASMGKKRVPDLKPVLTWKTKIVQIKKLPEGSFVGYGCTFRTTRPTTVAVLPAGYADGYDRSLGNNAHVLVKGKRAPVIGRVCMNLIMIDVTDIPGHSLEDEVVLLGTAGGETVSAETMAEWAGTINYEIVTRINPLLERRIV